MTKANECTCPSGDGSLRHPCPAHPASVELAGVAANLTFINGRPAMCGCQVEYSSGGGEYSDVIYVTLCAKHSGSAILDLVATNRIALTPEYEGQWHADLYLDREIPLAKAEGATPAEAVLALMSAERIDPEQGGVDQAGGDRWDALQSIMEWTAAENIPDDRKLCLIRNAARAALAQPSPVRSSLLINGYQLRAALEFIAPDGTAKQLESEARIEWRQQDADFLEAGLYAWCAEYPEEGCVLLDEEPATAQPSPAQAEQAEAERPEAVAWQYRVTAGPQTGWSLWHPGKGEEFERSYTVERRPLMTVAQYDRIVGELRAVIAQLRQHKNDYMDSGQETYRALQNEIREREAEIARLDGLVSGRTAERDAALARVAELTATRNRYGVDAHYFNKNLQRILRDFESFTPDELARSLIILAKVADEKVVAQAQQLNDLDKQCRDDVARALGLRPNQERGFAWSYLLASIKSCVKASGDSAQAQQSVPEASEQEKEQGWTLDYRFVERVTELAASRTEYTTSMEATEQVLLAARELLAAAPVCRLSRSALTDAQMRRLYDSSTETENERLGFAAFARLIRRAEAVHQIAAAPGKEVGHE
ncbi:TPA: hypothetical protein ACRMUJ_003470 [Pseudomonas aeruginosa]|uniref:hypothetical protein n=1 Tax=Pseudomonas aeruginosa TaxID=287 RepID=UPI000AA48621|nr:hypothetical protein [Pseudomonas aeruginosa]HCF1994894.1 hypothetical protein [Pseudomonas aeruginosa]